MERDIAIRGWCIERALALEHSGVGIMGVDYVIRAAQRIEQYIETGQAPQLEPEVNWK